MQNSYRFKTISAPEPRSPLKCDDSSALLAQCLQPNGIDMSQTGDRRYFENKRNYHKALESWRGDYGDDIVGADHVASICASATLPIISRYRLGLGPSAGNSPSYAGNVGIPPYLRNRQAKVTHGDALRQRAFLKADRRHGQWLRVVCVRRAKSGAAMPLLSLRLQKRASGRLCG